MKRAKKIRWSAAALAICLMLGCLPLGVFASDTQAPAGRAGTVGRCIGAFVSGFPDQVLLDRQQLAYLDSSTITLPFSLALPSGFAITRPTSALTTTASSYCITGYCDPGLPLYVNGQQITPQGSQGMFTHYVQLAVGTNQFVFSQGGESHTVTITRTSGQTVQPISKITWMYPDQPAIFRSGEELTLSCIAPAGAQVTAQVGDFSLQLSQVASAQQGVPATFRASVPLSANIAANETVNFGAVGYVMTYQGSTTRYTSSGALYICGSSARPAVQVADYMASIYTKAQETGQFDGLLGEGAQAYVTGEEGDFFALSSGGYLKRTAVKVLTGAPDLSNTITAVTYQADANGRARHVRLSGAAGASYVMSETGSTISFHLYNTAFASGLSISGVPGLVSADYASDGAAVLTFEKPAAGLWGAYLYYDGEDAVIYMTEPPTLSGNSSQPLLGVNVVLDPGHGGIDSGALGVAGLDGPTEKTLNLANALILKQRLEQLGATVALTRSGDEYLTLFERLEKAEDIHPDFLISLHHNSVPETSDGSKAAGVEVYYHYPVSKSLSDGVLTQVSQQTGRTARGSNQSYYIVTKTPYVPSILIELGFLPNAAEYERLTDPQQIYLAACGIANTVVSLCR